MVVLSLFDLTDIRVIEVGKFVDMNTVLPAHAFRIKLPAPLVLVPPTVELQRHLLTTHNDKSKANDPAYGFLSQNHLSCLCSHHMGCAAVNPFWDMDFLVDNDYPLKPIPEGLSKTMEVYCCMIKNKDVFIGKRCLRSFRRICIYKEKRSKKRLFIVLPARRSYSVAALTEITCVSLTCQS